MRQMTEIALEKVEGISLNETVGKEGRRSRCE